jgi:hypothetical protein
MGSQQSALLDYRIAVLHFVRCTSRSTDAMLSVRSAAGVQPGAGSRPTNRAPAHINKLIR